IQSFAIPGSDELDLTKALAVLPSNALAGAVFNDTAALDILLNQKLSDVKTALPEIAATFPTAAKDPADMRDILDAAIATYSDLTDAMKAALESIADSNLSYGSIPTDKIMILTGKLI